MSLSLLKINFWKFRRRKKYFFLFLLVIFVARFVRKMMSNFEARDILDLEKCPFCYGISACEIIGEAEIESTKFSKIFSKNVFYARINGTRVVLKKLASDKELADFDEMVRENENHLSRLFSGENTREKYDSLVAAMDSDFLDLDLKLRLCPSTKNAARLLRNIPIAIEDFAYFWTMLKINPEPLILEILPAGEGWPVPRYRGACGRVIVEDYIGSPLLSHADDSWIRRAKIASSLLDAAHKFTFAHPEFSFYMTDWSWDNIAVDSRDNAKFVDLENVIVVDKSRLEGAESRKPVHKSETLEQCKGCFAFSPADICSSELSDHNYFGVCQEIISESKGFAGLLQDAPPADILERFPSLMRLIEECSEPRDPSRNRIEFGIQLKETLDKITASFQNIDL